MKATSSSSCSSAASSCNQPEPLATGIASSGQSVSGGSGASAASGASTSTKPHRLNKVSFAPLDLPFPMES